MIKQIILVLVLFSSISSSSQTKEECVKFLKTVDRKMGGVYWINTFLKDNTLIRETYDERSSERPFPKEKETIDMSKVESVVIEYDDKFQSYYVNVYLDGDYYKRTNTYSESYTVETNRFNYFGFKDEKEAIKVQEYIIKLSKYCGSKPLKY